MFWDSPPVVNPAGRREQAPLGRTNWFRAALENAALAGGRTLGSDDADGRRRRLVLDDATAERAEGGNGADDDVKELEHLRRHVDELTTLCADAEARAKAGALAMEKLEAMRGEMKELKESASMRDRAETRAKAAESRAKAARDAMVSAKLRHEEALKKVYSERDAKLEGYKVEVERLRSESLVMRGKFEKLAEENESMEVDLAEYARETEYLDEVIAQHEEEVAKVLEEKLRLERLVNTRPEMSFKSIIMSPFASSPRPSHVETPRLAGALRWFEDVVASPLRSPFADITNASEDTASDCETDDATKVAVAQSTPRFTPGRKSRLGFASTPRRTPGVVEDSAEEENSCEEKLDDDCAESGEILQVIDPVLPEPKKKSSWKIIFSKVPESRLYGVPMSHVGAVRLRVVGKVSLIAGM